MTKEELEDHARSTALDAVKHIEVLLDKGHYRLAVRMAKVAEELIESHWKVPHA